MICATNPVSQSLSFLEKIVVLLGRHFELVSHFEGFSPFD